LLAAVAPALALSDAITNEREENRRLLENYRTTDPEKYAQLLRGLQVFQSLPTEVQDQIRKLDRDLRKEDSATREHLLNVLRRYDAWLQSLSEAERNSINLTQNPKERMQIIKKIRERQWLERLPAADRKKILDAPEPQRARLIHNLRQAELQRRQDWQITLRFWKEIVNHESLPVRMEEFSAEVKAFYDRVLYPLLTDDERQRVKNTEGKWPSYPRTLVELADKHPIAIPGPTGPVRRKALSVEAKKLKKHTDRINAAEGKWPEFGIALLEIEKDLKKVHLLSKDYQPSHPSDFSEPIQKFIKEKLLPALDAKEKERLKNAEGKWPNYPEILLELARKNDLQVPEMALPGSRESWDRYRLRSPAPVGAWQEPVILPKNLMIADLHPQ
jgi:hypothetical protein